MSWEAWGSGEDFYDDNDHLLEAGWLTPDQAKEKDETISELKTALLNAAADIRQWMQLGRYQREMMDQNLGWCPTKAGINASEAILGEIAKALVIDSQPEGTILDE